MENTAPLLVKALARVLIVWPTRLARRLDALYHGIEKELLAARKCLSSMLARASGRPILVNGEIAVPSRISTADFSARILGESYATVLDVGARWGGQNSWWRVGSLVDYVGFDPDPQECNRLNGLISPGKKEKYVPVALGKSNGKAKLYGAAHPACSSLFPAEQSVVDRYPACAEIRTVATHEVQLRRLDDWWSEAGKPHVAFVKIDTQGAELEVIEGGPQVLSQVMGFELEVEFSALYKGQPLFNEVDRYMREQGFVLWRLEGLTHYRERNLDKMTEEEALLFEMHRFSSNRGRLFWGNATYFRDHKEIPVTEASWKSLLVLSSFLDAMGDTDAARSCLKRVCAEGIGLIDKAILVQIEGQARNLY